MAAPTSKEINPGTFSNQGSHHWPITSFKTEPFNEKFSSGNEQQIGIQNGRRIQMVKKVSENTKETRIFGWRTVDNSPTTQVLSLFGQIVDKMLEGVIDGAKLQERSKLRENREIVGIPFSVNPTRALEGNIESLKKLGFAKSLIEDVEKKAREYVESRRGVGGFFMLGADEQSNQFLFYYGRNDYDAWKLKMILDSGSFIQEKFVSKSVVFKLTNEEEEFLGSKRGKNFSVSQMACFHFALLRACEPKAKEKINNNTEVTFEDLKSWGYRIVSHPDAGDLVLYFNDQPNYQHMGIYLENGKVESKCGIMNPNIYEHGVFDVPPNYGKKVVFMRKSTAKIFE